MSSQDSPQLVGRLLAGQYRIVSQIGQGGMGIVYRGEHIKNDTPIAVKALHAQESHSQSQILKRFQREGQLLRELNHPNIVGMLDAFEEDGGYYLITEYVAGGDLQGLLAQEKQLAIERTLSLALDLADALTRAHRIQIIHRDIKPANILLAADGTLKLTDFGIASAGRGTRLTEHRSLMGTIAYLSPEACLGQELDERADIWSFGVLLYQMLLGEVPFDGENVAAVLTAIMGQEVPDMQALRPEIPDGLADLVYRMLVKDRDGRIPSARLVGAELEGLLKGFEVAPKIRIATFATPKPEARERRIRLPAQSTRFVGRQKELAEIGRLLERPETRLLTLLGAGGMGKTRLGIEAAMAQAGNFADGVCFVDLASLSDADGIPRAMAEALRFIFSAQGKPQEQLLDYLRNKDLLLVLDNFEHLIAGAPFLSQILARCPGVKLLSTSRARLNLKDERVFEVGGMVTPKDEAEVVFEEVEAVELFISYARRARPDYELEEKDKPAVVQICRLVEGMPLGVQLAAGWVHTLSPGEIAEELEADLDFLASRLQDIPERQRSMRAAFDYSWKLLPEQLKAIFIRCSVFRGGFTLEAAKAVAEASVRSLSALVEQSMLQRTPEGRFHVHELMRQFAANLLAEEPQQEIEIRDRHWRFFGELLVQLGRLVIGDQEDLRAALNAYQEEFDNIQAAWDWAVAQERFEGMIGTTLAIYWCPNWLGWDREGYQMCLKAIRALEQSGRAQMDRQLQMLLWQLTVAAGGLGELSGLESRIDRKAQYPVMLERIVAQDAILDVGYWFVRLLDRIPPSYWETADHDQLELYDQAIEAFWEQGRLYEVSEALRSKGWYFNNALKRKEKALPFFEESLAMAKQAGSTVAQGFTHMALTGLWHQMGDYRKAFRHNQEEADNVKNLLDVYPSFLVIIYSFSASCLAHLGEYERARGIIVDALADSKESGNPNQRAVGLLTLCKINVMASDLPAAHQNLEAYPKLYSGYRDNPYDLGQYRHMQGLLAYHEGEFDAARTHFEESLAQFEKNSGAPDSVWAAGVLGLLGEVQRAAGQRQAARETLGEATRLSLDYTLVRQLMNALLGLAYWLRDEGRWEEAAEVAVLVNATMGTIHSDRERARKLLHELESQLSVEAFEAAKHTGENLEPAAVYEQYWGEKRLPKSSAAGAG